MSEGYCVDPGCLCHDAFAGSPRCCPRCHRDGPVPLTVVPPMDTITPEAMIARIHATQRAHGDVLQAYHEVWYNAGHTWGTIDFGGVPMMKAPTDLWVYQDIIWRRRPTTILETGTFKGGSALYFASLMDAFGIEGRVLTIDVHDHRAPGAAHARVTHIAGDSTDPDLAAAVLAEVTHPLLVVLDADHSAAHVKKELDLYAGALEPGDYLVVEDTNIAWSFDRGARGGLEDYLAVHPGEFAHDELCERYLLTMNPGGWLVRVAPKVAA